MTQNNPQSAQDASALEHIKCWIHQQTGIQFTQDKMAVLRSRLESLCMRYGYKNLEEIHRLITEGTHLDILRQVVEAATTNHTHFYREIEPLLYYRDTILPQLPQNEQCRIWSAASSTGEELYTLAMLSIDKLGFIGTKNALSFLGTDVNPRVIEQAEMGVYTENRLADLPNELKSKWFDPLALGSYAIKQELKDLCTYRKLNLKSYPWPFSRSFHVIFLRNVLYYFDEATQSEIVNNLHTVTQPGGWLITSVTENLGAFSHPWIKAEAGIYRKGGNA